MIKALVALFTAAAALMRVLPLWWARCYENEIDDLNDEIHRLADSGTPADELRLEFLAKRKGRKTESLRALRAALGDNDSR